MAGNTIELSLTIDGKTISAVIAKTLVDDLEPFGVDAIAEVAKALAAEAYREIKEV